MPLILCTERNKLPDQFLPEAGALPVDPCTLQTIPFCWVERVHAEQDETHKQWIPYAVITCNGSIACYPRRGSETRLHDYWSCGFGGHVEKSDEQGGSILCTLKNSLERELWEECRLNPSNYKLDFLGIVNEDLSAVGRVHIACVFLVTIANREIMQSTEEISQILWMDPHSQSNTLECWSQLSLNLLSKSKS